MAHLTGQFPMPEHHQHVREPAARRQYQNTGHTTLPAPSTDGRQPRVDRTTSAGAHAILRTVKALSDVVCNAGCVCHYHLRQRGTHLLEGVHVCLASYLTICKVPGVCGGVIWQCRVVHCEACLLQQPLHTLHPQTSETILAAEVMTSAPLHDRASTTHICCSSLRNTAC